MDQQGTTEFDMKMIKLAIAASLLATGAGAAAQSATEARCIVLANIFGQQAKDDNAKQLAQASLYFYLGRMTGQPTAAQMKAALDQQAKTLTDANAGQLMGDCVKPVRDKVLLLQAISPQQPAKPPAKPEGR
jgi:hypothetical protein